MERKIIGWTSYDDEDFLGLSDKDIDQNVLEALAKEIKDNHFFFSGLDHQEEPFCAPVLDNYRIITFSRTGFEHLLNSIYSDNKGKIMDTKKPSLKYSPDINIIEVSEQEYAIIENNLNDFNEYFAPFKFKDNLWTDSSLIIKCGKKALPTLITKIYSFKNYQEFLEYKDRKVINEKNSSLELIESQYKNEQSTIILGLIKSDDYLEILVKEIVSQIDLEGIDCIFNNLMVKMKKGNINIEILTLEEDGYLLIIENEEQNITEMMGLDDLIKALQELFS